ncbi:unnamed protein product [Symbiodinium necroappetens]|uniref:Uncharacterized protein n=1 Tax=Symbiodinium necroappetens TaxID=1628268 RepID=A0A812ISZ2_9DINO|nr:unnamed protein product [Symbiodinium necroappetens]
MLSTWELPEDDPEGTPYKRDEVHLQGFLVPGRVDVYNAFGQTGRENAAILGRSSDLFFDMTTTAPVQAGSDLVLQARGAGPDGFKLFSEGAELWTLDSEGVNVERKLGQWYCEDMRSLFDPDNETAMNLTKDMYLPHRSACEWDTTREDLVRNFDRSDPNATRVADTLVLRINEAAPVASSLRLRFQVQTPEDRTNFLEERWHLTVQLYNESTSVLEIIATNDGAPVPLSVVTQLPTEPTPEPSQLAPLARAEVVFMLDPLDTGAEAFVLTAPLGYTFVHPCRVPFQENQTNNVDEMRCLPLPAANGLSRARVDCEVDPALRLVAGLGTECLRNAPTVVYVASPEATVPDAQNVWFVEAVALVGTNYTSVGDRLGRGTFTGFEVVDMEVQVVYGALASVPVDVGVAFTSRVDLPRLGQVVIEGPQDLQQFSCENKRGRVLPVSLGPLARCQTTSSFPPTVVLTLNQSLPSSLHVVIIPAETSRQDPQPSRNVFNVFLRAPDGRNMDVSLTVPGEPIVQGIRASVLPFWWTELRQYDDFFDVTVPVEILDDVDIDLWGILIDFPKDPDFQLHALDVQVSTAFGEGFYLQPVSPFIGQAGGGRLLVRLDPNRKPRTGMSLIQFPVTRPFSLPLFNFWRVALCGSAMGPNGEGCELGENREDRGAAVICVFANGGFDPSEPSSAQVFRATTGSTSRVQACKLRGAATAQAGPNSHPFCCEVDTAVPRAVSKFQRSVIRSDNDYQ